MKTMTQTTTDFSSKTMEVRGCGATSLSTERKEPSTQFNNQQKLLQNEGKTNKKDILR